MSDEVVIEERAGTLDVTRMVRVGSMHSVLEFTLTVDPASGIPGVRLAERIVERVSSGKGRDVERLVADRVVNFELDGEMLDAMGEWLAKQS